MPAGKKYKLIEILLIFIAAGGAGNMIDRFMNGYVVDFIYISCINFPIFNVADMYVSVCTVLLVIIVLTRIKEEDYEMFEKSLAAPFKKIHEKTDEQ
jgi:signal peptidase II